VRRARITVGIESGGTGDCVVINRGVRRIEGPRTIIPGPLRTGLRAWSNVAGTDRSGLPLGCQYYLRPDVLRMGLCGVCDRCVRPSCRRVATIDQPAHRSCARRVGYGDLGPPSGWPGPVPTHTAQRPRRALEFSQYRAIRYTDRLADAEAFNSLFEAELIRNKGPWRGINDLKDRDG
jgi:hypothetical protein